MMDPDILQSSWTSYNSTYATTSPFGHHGLSIDSHMMDNSDFSSLYNILEDSSQIPPTFICSTLFSSDSVKVPLFDDGLFVDDISMEFEDLEQLLNGHIMQECQEESWGSLFSSQPSIQGEGQWSPSSSTKSDESTNVMISTDSSFITFPEENMEIDNHLSIRHLLKAYGEAMEMDQKELAEVVLKHLSEKISPVGETLERLAFNLTCDRESQGDYLRQESWKNFEAAFMAFYQMFPHGRFAHFAANSAILEAMPGDAETIHIVDFDMGDGVQWPPLIEALAKQQKRLKLTAIKWEEEEVEEDDDSATNSWQWNFEETKRKLLLHARPLGLNLKVEEMGIEDLVRERTKLKREWLAFNCMVGLPHMGRGRSRRRQALEFLEVAKDLIANPMELNKRGLLTLGDGDACWKVTDSCAFDTFFDRHVEHYETLLESIESNCPVHLAEARMAMECLFVGPDLSSSSWSKKWKEMRDCWHIQEGIGLEGWRVSKESFMEAKEMVRREPSYGIRIGGEKGNEMMLEWRATPLVRFSSWTDQI